MTDTTDAPIAKAIGDLTERQVGTAGADFDERLDGIEATLVRSGKVLAECRQIVAELLERKRVAAARGHYSTHQAKDGDR